MTEHKDHDDGRDAADPDDTNAADTKSVGATHDADDTGARADAEPSLQEHHNPQTDEDTASGGAPED